MTYIWRIRILGVAGLFTFLTLSHAYASDFTFNVDKKDLKWGELFSITIETTNPLDSEMRGGMTISFSSNVIVVQQDPETKIYYEGSDVYRVGHQGTVKTKNIMVENWYWRWPAHARKTMKLQVFALKTGVLDIYARAAFLISARKNNEKVVAIPNDKETHVHDQQEYPASIVHVLVQESPDFLRNIQLLINDPRMAKPSDLQEYLQRLLINPADQGAWEYFGIKPEQIKDSRDILTHLQYIVKPEIRNSPYFMDYLKRLINHPMDCEALKFFGITCVQREETQAEKDLKSVQNEARTFISEKRGGDNLLSLIDSEGDIQFIPSRSGNLITIRFRGNSYEFPKNESLVLNLAKKIMTIKPSSKYIAQPDPFSNSSYRDILQKVRP